MTMTPFQIRRIIYFKERILYRQINNGIILPPEIKHILIYMFIKIQDPFKKHSQGRNSLNSDYLLCRFLELLGQPIFLKLPEPTLFSHDRIFEKICKELNWPFKSLNFSKF